MASWNDLNPKNAWNAGKKIVTDQNPVAQGVKAGYAATQGDWKGAATHAAKAGAYAAGGQIAGNLAAGTIPGAAAARPVFQGLGAAAPGAISTVGGAAVGNAGMDAAKRGVLGLGNAASDLGKGVLGSLGGLGGGGGNDPNSQAGDEILRAGQTGYDLAQRDTNRALDSTLPAARHWRNTYETGELATPGVLERLYEERRAGTSPDQLRARELGHQGISKAMAARGIQNSGAALRSIGNLEADLAADESRQMTTLAAGAQAAKEGRLTGGYDRLATLGRDRAGIVQDGSGRGIDSLTSGMMGSAQAKIAAAQAAHNRKFDFLKLGSQFGGSILGALT